LIVARMRFFIAPRFPRFTQGFGLFCSVSLLRMTRSFVLLHLADVIIR
jgi:hypothetical protein